MVRPVGSKGQREAVEEQKCEEKITEAVTLVNAGKASYDIAAQKFGLPRSTVYHSHHGRTGIKVANEKRQSLMGAQEDEIIDFVRELDSWSLHLRRSLVIQRAESILKAVQRRHPDLRTALSQRKDIARSKAEKDLVQISEFYANLARVYGPPYNIRPENMYNVDEKGFMLGVSSGEHVVVFRRTELDRQMGKRPNGPVVPQDGNRELITVLDCICADGTVLPPLIIMKGKLPSYSSAKDSLLDKACIAASPNGWTDNELGLAWVQKVFEPETREK
ncbi:DDE superfamily endonuclease-domain-containing protein [Mycena rebaudengoi]|nr:DDE superfamily endonuclease-domain-containing protein [Mycena rebaudengoi]